MEVSDEIVVINEGRVEQVGTPDQLYDEPANDFVMGFLGDVTNLGEVSLRPHDVEVALTPDTAGGIEGVVSRMLRVGFEVRLTVLTIDGQDVSVTLTRTHARALGLEEGATVWLTPAAGSNTVPRITPGALAVDPDEVPGDVPSRLSATA